MHLFTLVPKLNDVTYLVVEYKRRFLKWPITVCFFITNIPFHAVCNIAVCECKRSAQL